MITNRLRAVFWFCFFHFVLIGTVLGMCGSVSQGSSTTYDSSDQVTVTPSAALIKTLSTGLGGTFPVSVGFNPLTNSAYIANLLSDNVFVMDSRTKAMKTIIPVRHAPIDLTVNPRTNRIYVSNFLDSSISVIDGTTNQVLALIPVPGQPYGIRVNPTTNRIYAALYSNSQVAVIDGATNSVLLPIPVGNFPRSVEVNPNTNRIYVTTQGSQDGTSLSVIDGSTNLVIAALPIGTSPNSIAVDQDFNTVYVDNTSNSTVTVINGANNQVITAKKFPGSGVKGISVNSATHRVFVGDVGGFVNILDSNTLAILARVGVGDQVEGVFSDEASNQLYITQSFNHSIQIMNENPFYDLTPVRLGNGPSELKVNPVTNRVYVTFPDTASVMVLDGSSQTVLATIPVNKDPIGLAVNPTTNRIYVVHGSSRTFSVIDGFTNRVINTLQFSSRLNGIDVNPTTNLIYLIDTSFQFLTVIDGASTTILDKIPLEGGIASVTINPITNRIYVTNTLTNTVSVLDSQTNQVISTITNVGLHPNKVGINPVTNLLYVMADKSLTVVDGQTNTVRTSFPMSPISLDVNAKNNRIYVTQNNSSSLLVLDGVTNSTRFIGLGEIDYGRIAINPITNRLYLSNFPKNLISIVAGEDPPGLNMSFMPESIVVNESSALMFTLSNPNETPLTGVAFSNSLPEGLVVASPNEVSDGGVGGTLTAVPGSSVITLENGTLGPKESKTITVRVTSTIPGIKTNVTAINSFEGGLGESANATLTIKPDIERPVVSTVSLSKTKVNRQQDPSLVISWVSTDNVRVTSHDLLFAVDGQTFTEKITSGLPGNVQSFTWTVPANLPKTKTGAVKVIAKDGVGNTGEAISTPLIIR